MDRLALVVPSQLERHIFLPHECPELGVVVGNEKLVVLTLNISMLSGDRDISNSNFAFVTPAQSYPTFGCVLHDHNTLFLLASSLADQIGPNWSIESNQFFTVNNSLTILHLNKSRKFAFTNFALKLGKVIVLRPSNDLLLHLYSNPLSQTGVVNSSTGSNAFTRIE